MDRDQVGAAELMDRCDDGKTPDELRDQAVLDEILWENLLEHLAHVVPVLGGIDLRSEAHAAIADSLFDHLVEVREGAAADEVDVRRVDRQELLMGMLAPTLRRDRSRRARRTSGARHQAAVRRRRAIIW